ncbi:hypothetical protein [Nostoc flagelliforme]|uniref:hypothetical protein n=1 Tax=Nostoc flagelliforme TaxID=1306274 RepID=UPI0012FE41ED
MNEAKVMDSNYLLNGIDSCSVNVGINTVILTSFELILATRLASVNSCQRWQWRRSQLVQIR